MPPGWPWRTVCRHHGVDLAGARSAHNRRPSRLRARGRVMKQSDIAVSFEFFPPRGPEAEVPLVEAIDRLAPLAPSFVSETYGAGGSTRERTHATVARILRETTLRPGGWIAL